MENKKCCYQMIEILKLEPNNRVSPFEDLNALLYFDEKFDEYGIIIHDGGESYIKINYCPWCGKELPESKRNLWFDELEKLGYENPFEDDIPIEFKSNAWRMK